MRLSKIIFLAGTALAVVIVGTAVYLRLASPVQISSQSPTTASSQSSLQSGQPITSQNAFLPGSGSYTLSGSQGASQQPTFQGKAVSSLGDVAAIIASASSSIAAPRSASVLAPPDVPDADIAIDPSGVSTTLAYLAYFNAHAPSDIVFNNSRLAGVLKDQNGVMLFPQGLINKAIADNNFGEAHDSLVVEKDFVTAEIIFLKSIKVTGSAVALNKETIGTEELLSNEITKALAVGSGQLSTSDFLAYENQFSLTVQNAHAQLLASSGVLAIAPPQNWLDHLLAFFGIKAEAQAAGNVPFGGPIVAPVPCLCDAGFWIIVGTPVPATLFVPVAFLATPLFYLDKSLAPGAWWLGMYDPTVEIPCVSGVPPACAPIGTGGGIIIAGTSGT
jgi:hypothetical protein